MNVETLFAFLSEKFLKLPKWLRNTTYIVILFLFVYLKLFPSYLDGRMVTKDPSSGVEGRFLKAGFIRIWDGGRRVDVKIDDASGEWHIPMPSRMPFRDTTIWVVDETGQHAVTIPYLKLAKNLSEEFVVIGFHANAEKPFQLVARDKPVPLHRREFSLLSTAWAAENSSIPSTRSAVSVQELVVEARELSASNRPSEIEQSRLHQKVAESLGVQVTGAAWREALDKRQLASLIENSAQPKIDANFGKKVAEILSSYLPQRDLYIGSDLPPEKLRRALAARKDSTVEASKVFGLIDATIFGSASNHLLFTPDGMYFRTSSLTKKGDREGYLAYTEFPKLKFAKVGWFEVALGPNQNIDMSGSSVSSEKLVSFLNDVKTAVLISALN